MSNESGTEIGTRSAWAFWLDQHPVTIRDVLFALLGWQVAILVRLVADLLLAHLDRRKARQHAAAPTTTQQ